MVEKSHILIVDDVVENIQLAMSLLRGDGYQFSYANNGEKALTLIEQNGHNFDLILLDIMMPGMDGFEVCTQIKANPRWQDLPIIFLTARTDVEAISKAFAVGGVDYLSKPFHGDELLARVRTQIQLFNAKKCLQEQNLTLEGKVQYAEERLLSELENAQKEMIWMLTELMESTSDETGKHVRRVAELSALFAKLHPALTEDDERTLFHASPMHDIGKMTIPYEILHKPGRYTPEEYDVMKMHTTNAYNLLSTSERKLTKAAAIIAHEHHEKWDGSGYPRGLKGSDIHIYGRVVALADVLDALTHVRCYKDAWKMDDVVVYISDERGQHFDPELVDIFIDNLNLFTEIIQIS